MASPVLLDSDFDSLDVSALEALIRHHNHLYWDKNAPEISDTDFDKLVRRLTQLAPSAPVLSEMGPSGGSDDLERFGASVKHKRPMLSLDKCYGDDELRDWAKSFTGEVVVTPKFDGIACSIWYDEKGELSLATTRGDGTTGDDITINVKAIKSIPKRLTGFEGREIEIRGEIFMRLSVFARYKEQFSNPRNLTAGAIKQKDPKKSAAYGLSFGVYDLLGSDAKTEAEKQALLEAHGFEMFERKLVSKEDVVETYRAFAELRTKLDFEIDGIVFKANDVAEQERLGNTSHHPRYAIAYKFQGDSGTTILRGLEWSVARTGAITPVALIDPVMLSGALVSRASLHHAGYIKKLGLTMGAEVLVTRRGGVIPNVEHVTKAGPREVELPTRCPSCGSAVIIGSDFMYCSTPQTCRSARMGQLAHFVGVVDIQGFGDRMLGELYDRALVRSPADLYTLEAKKLREIDRVGERLATKLVAEVEAHRSLPLEVFLRSLGVDELGKHVSKILANEYKTLETVLKVRADELASIHSIGDVIAKSVTEGLSRARPLIDELLQHVTLQPVEEVVADAQGAKVGTGPLLGQSFVFTGKMATLERKAAQERVLSLGGAAPDSVTKNTSYLVIGDDKSEGKKSSKEKTADKLVASGAALKIISESEFLAMVEGLSAS